MPDVGQMIGRTLLHYEIVGTLGAGGMGEVYRARDTKLGREVALKVVPAAYAADPRRLARFEREARAVAALNHPNIVTIHSIEQDGDVHFLTMELVEGTSVDRVVPSGGLPVDRVLEIAVPLVQALEAAHQRGIIHRDLKPANIMITDEGRVKVLDFGLAKLLSDSETDSSEVPLSMAPTATAGLTAEGVVVGTTPYLSPEYLDGRPADRRSDIFSLGVVLYEMVTGLLPFRGRSGPAMMSSILRDAPPPVAELKPETPLHLTRVIERCLAKDPAARFQSAADVGFELETVRDGSASGTLRAPAPRLPGGRRLRLAGAVALALLLISIAALLWQRHLAARRQAAAAAAAPSTEFDPRDWIIAVIPSATGASESPELAAVNEGLTLTLTAKLAQLSQSHGLQVIPASTLVEEEIDSLDKARRELGVTLALNFDTHRLGDRIRVNALLVDVPNRRQISAETLDGDPNDLLALEEAVTSRVLSLLRVELRPMEKALLAAGTANPSAYSFYLRGRGHLQDYHDPASVEAAAELFEEALRIDADYAEAHAGLGEALWHQYLLSNESRWVEAALRRCQTAVELDPLEADGHVCLGTVYIGTGRYQEAVDELKIAKSLDPSRDLVFKGLADAYLARGELELAEDTYKEAVAARPHYWAPHNWLGIFYHRQGRPEEALASFSEVVRLAPDSYLGYSNLGASYYFAGRPQEARENFERALAIKPEDDLALSNLGTMSFFEGRYEEAIRLFERAVEINDQDYFNWGQLADAYHWSDAGSERAAAAYRRAISLCEQELVVNAKNAILLSDLAYFQAMLGSPTAALASLRRALDLLPSDIDVQHRAAQVYQALGRSEPALEFLGEAIRNGYPAAEVAADPLFAALATDPDFQRLLQSARPELSRP